MQWLGSADLGGARRGRALDSGSGRCNRSGATAGCVCRGGGSPALRLPVCRVGGRVSRTGGALEAGRAGQVVHDDDATHAVGAPSGRVKAGEGEAAAVQYGGDVLVEAALGLVAAEAALPVLLVSVPARSPH